MRLRCFLCRYGDGSEAVRWFLPEAPDGWAQQVLVLYLEAIRGLAHTGSDPSAVFYMPGFKQLIEAGMAEEL